MEDISLLRCTEYEYNQVKAVIDKSFENLGGVDKFIKPNMKVLLKANLLMKKRPEEATTTHPIFVEALTRAIQEAGGIVTIADSPGGIYTEKMLSGVYEVTGMKDVSKRTGANLNYDVSFEELVCPEGKICKRFPVIKPVKEADLIITVPKLKTHGMTYYTGAVKNLFGVIPGTYKAEYHFRMQALKDFCDMLIDLCELVKPTLSFMDAIVGMEGHGPSGGEPRFIGAIIAGTNPYAVDLVASNIIGIKPNKVFTILNSIERGLCPKEISDVNILGDDILSFLIKDYKMPTSGSVNFFNKLPPFINNKLNALLSPKPIFLYDICVGCRECEKACPPKAIVMKENKPLVDYAKCIKCFCCQELCPKKAVEIKRAKWVQKLLK